MNCDILVTGYKYPDLDGIACVLAYSELLRSKRLHAVGGVFGPPHREASFVMSQVGIEISDGNILIDQCEEVRLVDACDLGGISDQVDPEMVTEVIDHRDDYDPDSFPNANAQIELVGAAATLITERFMLSDINPSNESANLLYSAIISNTLNLQANVTSDRDKKALSWLENNHKIYNEIIDEMFEQKSDFDINDLKNVFEADFASFSIDGRNIGIVQLEIINAKEFFDNNTSRIRETLGTLISENELDYALFMAIDLKQGYDIFLATEERLEKILENMIDLQFENGVAVSDQPILRKEIIPEIKENFYKYQS